MSNNIATKLQAILSAKGDIKDAIEGKGVTVGSASLDQYASKIEAIQGGDTDGLNGFLSVESKTIPTSASATTNITYNKNCGIIDENYKKWDTLDWHQRWVDNGYSATGLSKPIGIWMKAFGLDIVYLFQPISNVSFSDVSGTATLTNSTYQLAMQGQAYIVAATAADRTIWPANQSGMIAHGTAGKYKSATWRAANNGEGLDMVCDNTLETFTIPSRDVNGVDFFMSYNGEERMESFYQQCEFYRALFAICSGVATTQPNGTKTTVEILNSSGQQAAVNEDMYFWIGGTNTGLLAKYNLNCTPSVSSNVTTGYLTQTIADAIYNKQIAAGINMNDTGVNSPSKHVLCEGSKGAEAVAVGGYWYIKTPFISAPNATTFNASNNMADAQGVYLCKSRNITIDTDRKLYPFWLNKQTHITSLYNLLATTEGYGALIPSVTNLVYVWSSARYKNNVNNGNTVRVDNGMLANQTFYTRNFIIPTTLSAQQFTT